MAIMDVEKMLDKLQKKGMTHAEAIEYFETQILGAYAGPESPVYMHIPNFETTKGAKAT